MFESKSRILLLAAALVTAQLQAQPALEAAADRQREIVAEIDRIQSEQGLQSGALIEPLSELALFYEENDDDLFALATTERILTVIRDNFGLYSLEQVPTLRQLIRYAEARGDFEGAWNLEERMKTLAQRYPEDLASVPIWEYLADLRMNMLDRYVVGELPVRMTFGCYHDTNVRLSSCITGSRDAAARNLLKEAHDFYNNAIDVLIRNDQYESEHLRQLEMSLVVSSFRHGRFLRSRSGVSKARNKGPDGCESGIGSLRRLHDYNMRNLVSIEQRLNSLLQIADARLLCEQLVIASREYQQAYELAVKEGLDAAALERIFAPQTPVPIPTFLPGPLVVADSSSVDESVEVAFELSRYGLSRSIDVRSDRRNPIAGDVRREIRRRRFRPEIVNGEVVASQEFVVSYSLAE